MGRFVLICFFISSITLCLRSEREIYGFMHIMTKHLLSSMNGYGDSDGVASAPSDLESLLANLTF